jgi:hypothetical protein
MEIAINKPGEKAINSNQNFAFVDTLNEREKTTISQKNEGAQGEATHNKQLSVRFEKKP